MSVLLRIVSVFALIVQSYTFPERVTEKDSFIIQPLSDIQNDAPYEKEGSSSTLYHVPKIYEMHVDSNVSNRFAHTLIKSKVKNFDVNAQETVFSIVLPQKAFISKFVLSIGGNDYNAYVEKTEEAKALYEQAVSSGRTAGLVAANARDSNRFTISVNIEPQTKVIFLLTYEQLLERNDNQYELVINISPKQQVDDLIVTVNINESHPLMFVRAPPIRSGNEISKIEGDLDPRAQIHQMDSNSAVIKFSPNKERQKEIAQILGTNAEEGLSGQFIVQYDVERAANGGEILLHEGYFVHFFAPPHVKPIPKYVLFVLDTSGSMYGTKISQLKTAMKSILSELREEDTFHLVDFNSIVKVLDLENHNTVQYPSDDPSFSLDYNTDNPPSEDITLKRFADSYTVNEDNINKANGIVDNMESDGGTNIADGLKVALHLVDVDKNNNRNANAPQPIIIFLTDGDATVGVTDPERILAQVKKQNKFNTPIFSLSFGDGADKTLLQKLSLRNNGFSRHIYEASDASLQLQDFYKQISSPILSNVTFKYIDETKELTKTEFPILFEGSELVVAGRLDKDFDSLPKIMGEGANGPIELTPEVRRPVTRLERLWAYLTIQQLLDDMERSDNRTQIEQKAQELALKYSFVTPITSLVVVKPNGTDTVVEPVPAEKDSVDNHQTSLALNSRFSLVLPDFDYNSPEVETTTLTPIEEIKRTLPWLDTDSTHTLTQNEIVLRSDGTIYKLGLNETSTDDITCPSTPNNGQGICKLIHECPIIHYYLTNIYIFQQFHCDIGELTGVCCPTVHAN